MTLPTSGPISIGMVAAELGIALPLSLGDSRVRALAGVPSGPISLGQLRGKSASTSTGGGSSGGGGGGGGTTSTLAASMYDANGETSATGTQYTYLVPVSIAVMGGTAPYSYAWSKLSGSGTLISSNSASASEQFVVGKYANPGDVYTAVVKCTVTDAVGAVVQGQANVTLTIT
jgi:hypothetical protein